MRKRKIEDKNTYQYLVAPLRKSRFCLCDYSVRPTEHDDCLSALMVSSVRKTRGHF